MAWNDGSDRSGEEPFVFVSYAHEDGYVVSSVIEGIVANGYKVWYDQGIDVTTIWTDEIAKAILGSRVFVVFVTKASMASHYVRSEVEFALDKNVKVIPIYLEGMDVMPPGLSLMLHSTQGIEGSDPQTIIFKICKWLMQQNIKAEVRKPSPSSPLPSATPIVNPVRTPAPRSPAKGRPVKERAAMRERVVWEPRPTRYRNEIPAHFFPVLRWLLRITLLFCGTEILRAWLSMGMQNTFLTSTLPYWGLSAVFFYWYFGWRYTGVNSLFNLLPNPRLLQWLLYVACLGGWLLMTADLENVRFLLLWISQLAARLNFKYMWDYRTIQAMNFYKMPEWLQTVGFYACAGSGGILLLEMIGASFRRHR
ncbi:MAG: toll/interleukin-1 receptor domain-containing protein [Synergistaceae bacterium]|jgi:hypothetical protein|nr:toll/interleukin-1 receptor domain-containing protein [Synergistaceae bacterium]